ncbi:uncharacterized protein LOC126891064 [Diabrotica virgifera virgifera]|uniref:Peptidase aspartic putative domain-containing protein n=1 Tax=Diabrotica virgifera virgifera TaxID=50390 RepID=A0ABM5L184_DIAVI|nr:uncharacterized protein LOC126891064 [Diabrotica virgifera virgifera]
MSNLKNLIKQRGVIKNKLSLFEKFIINTEQTINESQGDQIPDKTLLFEIEARLERQNSLLNKFDELQDRIDLLIQPDQQDERSDERDSFQNSYYKHISLARGILSKFSNTMQSDTNIQGNSNDSSCNSGGKSCSCENRGNVKLPEIKLPMFRGGYQSWMEFRSLYTELIHTNTAIKDAEKLYYLKTHLDDNVKRLIAKIDVTAENYKSAWDIINQRFNNKRMLIHNNLKTLNNISVITQESSSSLRQLCDEVFEILRSLNQLGVPTENWDPYIIFHLALKLDKKTADHWEAYKIAGEIPTLEEFKNFLNERANLLERKENNDSRTSNAKPKSYGKSFLSTNNHNKCFFCNGDHWITNCNDFLKLNAKDKFEKAKALKLCTNCLRNNHKVANCKSTFCKKCNLKHHSLLHFENSNLNANQGTICPQQSNLNTEDAITSTLELTNNSNISCNHAHINNVLLSTALINVKDSSDNLHVCRVLLDSGSQSNFISKNLCDKLKIPLYSTQANIFGINQVTTPVKYRCTISFSSLCSEFKHTISCLMLPSICSKIPSTPIDLLLIAF